jgi:hypothetical protein
MNVKKLKRRENIPYPSYGGIEGSSGRTPHILNLNTRSR